MRSDEIGELIGKIVLTLIFIPLVVLAHAATVSYLWEWFVVSQFAVPSLSLIAAYGLSLFVKFITINISDNHILFRDDEASTFKDKQHNFLVQQGSAIMLNLTILGLGWIVHSFM